MNNNNKSATDPSAQAEKLRSITGELTQVHGLLAALSIELGGGGIVQARDLQPMIAAAVPKLHDALSAMRAMHCGMQAPGEAPGPENNPLLM